MRDRKPCIAIALTMFCTVLALLTCGCDSRGPAGSEFEDYIKSTERTIHFQGSYLVAKGDSILASGGSGFADTLEGRRNLSDTKYLIGSLTKSFTAIATLQLVEEGLVELDQPICRYLPDYPSPACSTVTVHHLLSHRSGIPDLIRSAEFASQIGDSIAPIELMAFFAELPLEFAPGTSHKYSSSNYVVLGLILEAATGTAWDEYVSNHICEPAGMHNTGVYPDYDDREDFACGYARGRAGVLTPTRSIHPSRGYAAGALASNVFDLYALYKALRDDILVSVATRDLMFEQHSPNYGYGWYIDNFGGHRLIAHGGGVPGYVSVMQQWFDDSVCVVVLSNDVTVTVHTIANGLAAIALGEPYDIPTVKDPITMSEEMMRIYEGDYQHRSGELRQVRLLNGRLTTKRQSGAPYPVQPQAIDTFFYSHDHMTTLVFLRDEQNEVIASAVRQAFGADTAWRVEQVGE